MVTNVQAIHTVYDATPKLWSSYVEGSNKYFGHMFNKAEAIVIGKARASSLRIKHSIHSEDGAIVSTKSYSN